MAEVKKRQPTHEEVIDIVKKQTGKENPTVGDMIRTCRAMLNSNYIQYWPEDKKQNG